MPSAELSKEVETSASLGNLAGPPLRVRWKLGAESCGSGKESYKITQGRTPERAASLPSLSGGAHVQTVPDRGEPVFAFKPC